MFLSLFLVTGHRNFLVFTVLEFYALCRSVLTYCLTNFVQCASRFRDGNSVICAKCPNHVDDSRNQTEVTSKIYVTLDDKSRLISASQLAMSFRKDICIYIVNDTIACLSVKAI